ncbi:hypothetical protein [Staphylococcus aureus]
MGNVISLKEYRKIKEELMSNTLDNNHLKCWFNTITVNKNYQDSFVSRFFNYIEHPTEINKQDILLLLKGLSENDKLPVPTKKTIDKVFQLKQINDVLNNGINLKALKGEKKGKDFIFYKETLRYFKGMLELPEMITGYDIYMFVFCLRDSSDIEKNFFEDIAKVIYKSGVNPNSKDDYNKSLFSYFVDQP